MRTKVAIIILAFTAVVGSIYCVDWCAADDNAQLLEFVAMSLSNQTAACGASLEIEYTRVLDRFDGDGNLLEHGEKQYRYIRTPNVLRADTIENGEVVQQAFHDRNTREWRSLSVNGSSYVGEKGYGLGAPFLNSEFVETSLYRLERTPLVEWIARAEVVTTKEPIDGHECLRLHIPSGIPRPCSFEVWLDPAIGYNPRRIEIVHAADRVTVLTYAEYMAVADGAWFPKKMTVQFNLSKQNWRIQVVNTVSKITVGKTYNVEELCPVFPSGTKVYANDIEYIQP